MKCLILAALVGFCAATALYPTGHKIYFTDEDNVLLHGLYGNLYTFTQNPGQQYIDIIVNGVDTPMKKIRIDGETCQISTLQGVESQYLPYTKVLTQGVLYQNYFFNILKQYQGLLDTYQYGKLLQTIEGQVQEGKICGIIYNLLSYLDKTVNDEFFQKYITQYQHPVTDIYQKNFYGKLFGNKMIYGDINNYGYYPSTEKYYNYPSYYNQFPTYPYYKDISYGQYQQQYPMGYSGYYNYPSSYYGKSNAFDYLWGKQYSGNWYNQGYQFKPTMFSGYSGPYTYGY